MRAGSSAESADVPRAATCAVSCALMSWTAPSAAASAAVCASVEKIAARPTWKKSTPNASSDSMIIITGDDLAILAPQQHAPECNPARAGAPGSQDPSWGRDPDSTFAWDLFGSRLQGLSFGAQREVRLIRQGGG